MITTSEYITIRKTLRKGTVSSYDTSGTSLFLKHNGEQRRFNADVIVNSLINGDGYIRFDLVPLWGDGSYSLSITAENNSDLDTNGVKLVTLATGYIKKITNSNTLEL